MSGTPTIHRLPAKHEGAFGNATWSRPKQA